MRSVIVGTTTVYNTSLPISKSSANKIPHARRSLMVSFSIVCSLASFLRTLRKETKAKITEIPIIKPAAISIIKEVLL